MEVLAKGFNCWQANAVIPLDPNGPHIPARLRGCVALIFRARSGPDEEVHYPHQLIRGLRGLAPRSLGKWCCTCDRYASTGKQCEHLWATGVLQTNGPINLLEAAVDLARETFDHGADEDGDDEHHAGDEDTDHDDSDADSDDDDRPGDDRRLGYAEEERKPAEDDEGTFEYWNEDIMVAASLSGIDTIHSSRQPQPRTTSANSESPPAPKEEELESETGGLSNGEEADNAYNQKHPRGNRSGNPPGPPPMTQPLNAGRNKPAKSSLSLTQTDRDLLRKPAGITNTGDDCFAASLLQVLAHLPEWRDAFSSVISSCGHLANHPVGQIVQEVMDSIAKYRTQGFPLLNEVVASTAGQTAGQNDPAEVLRGLIGYLDDTNAQDLAANAKTAFGSIFNVSVRHHYKCQSCSTSSISSTNGMREYTEVILRAQPQEVMATVEQLIAQTMTVNGSIATRACTQVECQAKVTSGLGTDLKVQAQILVVEVSLSATLPSLVRACDLDSKTFDIRPTLRFGKDTWTNLEATGGIEWELAGIICYHGDGSDHGHYTAMFHKGIKWWEANDDKVREVQSIADCFEGTGTPRLLFYRRIQSDGKRPGQGKGKKNGKSKRNRELSLSSQSDDETQTKSKRKDNRSQKKKPKTTSQDRREFLSDADLGNTVSDPVNMDPLSLPITPKPAGFGNVPVFKRSTSQSGNREDAWVERYIAITWPLRNKKSLLTAARTTARFIDANQFDRLEHTLPRRVRGEPMLGPLLRHSEYIGTSIINEIAICWSKLRSSIANERLRGQQTTYAQELLSWVKPADEWVPRWCSGKAGPAPQFGRHPDWRTKRLITFLNVSHNEHWMAVMIFGPERLVVPFDSLGGALVHPAIKQVCTAMNTANVQVDLLSIAMEHPVEGETRLRTSDGVGYPPGQRTLVDRSEHEGKCPALSNMTKLTDQATASILDWPQQLDGSSCGPLTIAAMCMAMQGLKPTARSLGISLHLKGSKWLPSNAMSLRSSIFGFWVSFVNSDPDSNKHWDMTRAKGAESFLDTLREWLLTQDELYTAFDK